MVARLPGLAVEGPGSLKTPAPRTVSVVAIAQEYAGRGQECKASV